MGALRRPHRSGRGAALAIRAAVVARDRAARAASRSALISGRVRKGAGGNPGVVAGGGRDQDHRRAEREDDEDRAEGRQEPPRGQHGVHDSVEGVGGGWRLVHHIDVRAHVRAALQPACHAAPGGRLPVSRQRSLVCRATFYRM